MIGWRHLLPHPLATNYKNLRSWMRGCKLRTPSFFVRRRSLSFSIRSCSLMPTSRHGAHMSTSPYPNPSTPSRPHFLFFFPLHSLASTLPGRPQSTIFVPPRSKQPPASHHQATSPSTSVRPATKWRGPTGILQNDCKETKQTVKTHIFLVFVFLPTVHLNFNSSSCCFYILSCHASH